MSLMDGREMQRVIERVEELDEEFRKGLRERWEGIPPGAETVSDEEWLAFFQRRVDESGVAVMVDNKTGQQFVGSPFLVALGFVPEGRTLLRRYERLRGKMGANGREE